MPSRADIVSGFGVPPSKKLAACAEVSSTSGDALQFELSDDERRAALALDLLAAASSSSSSSSSSYAPPTQVSFASGSANHSYYEEPVGFEYEYEYECHQQPKSKPCASAWAAGVECTGRVPDREPFAHPMPVPVPERVGSMCNESAAKRKRRPSASASTCTALSGGHDPRAMQAASGRALVSHELRVEPADELAFELRVTTASRCSTVVCARIYCELLRSTVLSCFFTSTVSTVLCTVQYCWSAFLTRNSMGSFYCFKNKYRYMYCTRT